MKNEYNWEWNRPRWNRPRMMDDEHGDGEHGDDIKLWADGLVNELRYAIRAYLSEGWDKNEAIDTVLSGSCLGSKYKAQLRDEFKYDFEHGDGDSLTY